MGSGKSTVAYSLCENHQMKIVEMDQVIVDREGMSISQLFESKGEAYFRDIETELLSEIQGKEDQVISCGGGVVLREENVKLMKSSGTIIWLNAKPETILERVKFDDKRPLLAGKKNVAFISDMMDKRREKYQAAADITIQTDGKTIDMICQEIIGKVGE